MTRAGIAFLATLALGAGVFASSGAGSARIAPLADPTATPTETPTWIPTETPTYIPTFAPTQAPNGTPTQTPTSLPSPSPYPTTPATPTPAPTPPPILVNPPAAAVAVGANVQLSVQSAIEPIVATVHDPQLLAASVDPTTDVVTLTGKAPGVTVVTVADARGLTKDVPVRVAFTAGSIANDLVVSITGDPASDSFVRDQVARALTRAAQVRPGAQAVVGPDDVPFDGRLDRDRTATFGVPVLIQGNDYFSTNATPQVRVENVAVPRISPDALMVSDFPERLTENGELFSADLQRDRPSRFLYFHYNPPGQPDRRIVLRAYNASVEPAIVQFISGRGGPSPNEMEAGHDATNAFLVHLVQNEGRLLTIPANGTTDVTEQDLPAGSVVCNLLQLRVLSGGSVRLTLEAQNADDASGSTSDGAALLQDTSHHARGIYAIPEFHYATEWSVTDDYVELTIGQIPLQNELQGEALAGDYGVLESFVVNVLNPTSQQQSIAIYENPRGGRATGTFLIDGVLVQSHQVPAFSRYKLRQYVVPAKGFVRVTIVTMPEGGSSYPLKLIFAPDDGSVAPGAPGSPIY